MRKIRRHGLDGQIRSSPRPCDIVIIGNEVNNAETLFHNIDRLHRTTNHYPWDAAYHEDNLVELDSEGNLYRQHYALSVLWGKKRPIRESCIVNPAIKRSVIPRDFFHKFCMAGNSYRNVGGGSIRNIDSSKIDNELVRLELIHERVNNEIPIPKSIELSVIILPKTILDKPHLGLDFIESHNIILSNQGTFVSPPLEHLERNR